MTIPNNHLSASYRQRMQDDLSRILCCEKDQIPPVFTRKYPKVLKLGIYHDLVAKYPRANTEELSVWLRKWTSTEQYIRRVTTGRNRHDLDGADCGLISDTERADAQVRLVGKLRKTERAA